MALPSNALQGWNNLSSLVDDIWHHAGDTSIDVSNLLPFYEIYSETSFSSYENVIVSPAIFF